MKRVKAFLKNLAEMTTAVAAGFLLIWVCTVMQCKAEAARREKVFPFDFSSVSGVQAVTKAVETAISSMPETVKIYECPLDADIQLHIINECEKYHINPAVVIAQIDRESDFRYWVKGDSGNSLGLMQIQPKWHRGRMDKLGCTDLLDPYQNVTVGVDYLAELLDRYDGDIAKALTAYNQGNYGGVVSKYAKGILAQAEIYMEGMIDYVLQ